MLRHRMLPSGSRVIAAVSGGADSVCLLHVLRELGCPLAGVAHFNHKLRGEESDQDERFVADLARSLGLPFHAASVSIGDLPGNLEQNARRARREFFPQSHSERLRDANRARAYSRRSGRNSPLSIAPRSGTERFGGRSSRHRRGADSTLARCPPRRHSHLPSRKRSRLA